MAEEPPSLLWDEHGRHSLVLSFGHEATPQDKKKRVKWKCWVTCESYAAIDHVIFEDGISSVTDTAPNRSASWFVDMERLARPGCARS